MPSAKKIAWRPSLRRQATRSAMTQCKGWKDWTLQVPDLSKGWLSLKPGHGSNLMAWHGTAFVRRSGVESAWSSSKFTKGIDIQQFVSRKTENACISMHLYLHIMYTKRYKEVLQFQYATSSTLTSARPVQNSSAWRHARRRPRPCFGASAGWSCRCRDDG